MREAGYGVTATADFQEAKRLLDAHGPDLLIADVRLGPFNGLHLVIRTHFRYPVFRAILLDVKHVACSNVTPCVTVRPTL